MGDSFCFFFLVGTALAQVPDSNTVALYRFDEGFGTVANDATGNFPGTLANGAASVSPGRFGLSAVHFPQFVGPNGEEPVVDLGPNVGNGLAQYTVEAWIRFTNTLTPGQQHPSTKNQNSPSHYFVFQKLGGVNTAGISFGFCPAGGFPTGCDGNLRLCHQSTCAYTAQNTWTGGQWYHVAAVVDTVTNTLSIYVNGQSASVTISNPGDIAPISSSEHASIGTGIGSAYQGGYDNPFLGDIDEVCISNVAWTFTPSSVLLTPASCVVQPPPTIAATVDIDPDTLNKKSNGKWITAYIKLQSGFDVADIDVSTAKLNSVVPAEAFPTSVGDHDNDGVPDLMVKFGRAAVIALVNPPSATLTVTGSLTGGTQFEGSDTIRVINPGK
ncbi:MAG: LamG domain-containing protein [Halobacteria archaeon]